MDNNNQPKVGRFRRGWELTKCSLTVLKMDKSLSMLPVLSTVTSAIVCVVLAILGVLVLALIYLGNASLSVGHVLKSANSQGNGWPVIIILILLYVAITAVGNFFTGAIVFGANQRFTGGDPTVGSSIKGASSKFSALLNFSLMMATVGMLLNALERRMPLVGRIGVQLVGAAWNIANVFAIPVIVLSPNKVSPFEATKGSVSIIKKVWGESVVADLGISLIGLFSFLTYFVVWGLLGYLGAAIGHLPTELIGTLVVIAVLGFFALIVIFTALTGIAKAALYYYAVNGKAPDLFDTNYLSQSMRSRRSNI